MSTTPTAYRPDPERPDVDTPTAGRLFHYRTPDGRRLAPGAYLYQHPGNPDLPGWFGTANDYLFPDGYSPEGPASWDHVVARIEERLALLGFMVTDRPDGWAPPVPEERLECCDLAWS